MIKESKLRLLYPFLLLIIRWRRDDMNFETKYLIRWGIPGWVFLLMSLWPFIIFSKGVPVNDPVKSIRFIFSTAVNGFSAVAV